MVHPMNMTGKRVLVTGASSGIGRACAVLLSQLGAEVILLGRDRPRLEETLALLDHGTNSPQSAEGSQPARQHRLLTVDLAATESIADLLKAYDFKANKLDGLVHAAGKIGVMPIGMTTPKFMADILSVNFCGYVELCRLFSKRYYARDGASFVAISSTASQAAWKGGVAYCASKAALDAATRAMALEFVERRIRFNTVVPAFVRTKIVEEVEKTGIDPMAYVREKQPFGMGEPEDVAHAVAFLLSDAARFITGTSLVVDGGYLAQ